VVGEKDLKFDPVVDVADGIGLETYVPLFCSQQYVNPSPLASVTLFAVSLNGVPLGIV
jgi:hypothetical protein